MEKNPFQVGDTVKLKSDSPSMTVSKRISATTLAGAFLGLAAEITNPVFIQDNFRSCPIHHTFFTEN